MRNFRRHSPATSTRTAPAMFHHPVLIAAGVGLLALSACNSENAKGATEALVGTAVEVGKGAATGIAKGIVDGRKAGESADGAQLVTKWDDLKGVGTITVFETAVKNGVAKVTLAVENTSDRPMRVTELDVTGTDGDGFVIKPTQKGQRSVTVPAKAKVRHVTMFDAKKDGLKSVRVMGQELKLKK